MSEFDVNQAPATESTIGPSYEDEEIGEAEPSSVEARFPLDIHKRELTIFELHRKWQRGQLRLQPEFQRAFVWPESKQIKLAESDFDVVDGQQRLTTLFGFMEGRLPDDKAEKVIRRRESEPGQGKVFPNSLPSDEQAATIRRRFEELCGKTEFIGAILSATQTVKNVKVRMEEFEEICRDVR